MELKVEMFYKLKILTYFSILECLSTVCTINTPMSLKKNLYLGLEWSGELKFLYLFAASI